MIFRKSFQTAFIIAMFLSLLMIFTGSTARGEGATDLNSTSEQSPDLISAIHFVQQTGVNKSFKPFLLQAALPSTTIRELVATQGYDQVRPVLEREILNAISKYGDQWDTNLASSYLEFFMPEELESILKDKQKSPYFQKFRTEQSAVGDSMKIKSESILVDALGEVLLATFQTFMPDNKE